MLCNKCGKYPATVHIKQIVNGKQTELYLCPGCAGASNDFGIEDFFPNLFGSIVKKPTGTVKVCESCGMTLPRLSKEGKLGCSRCLETFEDYLAPTLKRLHGSTNHTGKKPFIKETLTKENPIEGLKKELKAAIDAEEYEKAAELRDKIRKLEKEGGGADE